jgi:integration host factor subunit beta
MTKSDLIQILSLKFPALPAKEVEAAVKGIVDHMAEVLAIGGRIEVRGFGSFSVRYRAPRTGRNPKTGSKVELTEKYVPHFKPGKDLRDRVNSD